VRCRRQRVGIGGSREIKGQQGYRGQQGGIRGSREL